MYDVCRSCRRKFGHCHNCESIAASHYKKDGNPMTHVMAKGRVIAPALVTDTGPTLPSNSYIIPAKGKIRDLSQPTPELDTRSVPRVIADSIGDWDALADIATPRIISHLMKTIIEHTSNDAFGDSVLHRALNDQLAILFDAAGKLGTR